MKKKRSVTISTVLIIALLGSITALGAPKKVSIPAAKASKAIKANAVKQSMPKKPASQNSNPKAQTRAQVEADLKAAVLKNVEASNNCDIKEYMSTIYNQEPIYSQTEKVLGQVFGAYKLSFKLIDYKVASIVGDTATVTTTIETRKISGPAYQDNRTVVDNIMRKQNGVWKFYGSKLISAEPIAPAVTTGSAINTTGSAVTTGSAINK